MEIEFFVFSKEDYQLFEFHENETKHDKRNFMRGMTVTFVSKVSTITEKIGLKFSNRLFL